MSLFGAQGFKDTDSFRLASNSLGWIILCCYSVASLSILCRRSVLSDQERELPSSWLYAQSRTRKLKLWGPWTRRSPHGPRWNSLIPTVHHGVLLLSAPYDLAEEIRRLTRQRGDSCSAPAASNIDPNYRSSRDLDKNTEPVFGAPQFTAQPEPTAGIPRRGSLSDA